MTFHGSGFYYMFALLVVVNRKLIRKKKKENLLESFYDTLVGTIKNKN